MPRQLDLIARPGLHVKPAPGRTEPRLWVRRLVIWSEPGVVLQDIALQPGLNIVWSPDPTDQETTDNASGALGHGSGKTLFCRLLRYCLGEDRFAPDGQRERIAIAFKDGLVGAEIVVDGTPWAIIRSIGLGRRHIAVPDGDLDALVIAEPDDAGGMSTFIEAVETRILSEEVAALVPGKRAHRAWLIALAWLTRDQECRFGDVLDWRSTTSNSDSPARGLSATKKLDALRALIGAIVPEEHALRSEIRQLEQDRNEAERVINHCEWEAKQQRARLIDALHLREEDVLPGPLSVEVFRRAARDGLARVVQVDPATDVADLEGLRATYHDARNQAESLANELAGIEARLPLLQRHVSFIQSELPSFSFSVHEAEHPLCPVCEVPIDRALAEGCKLSHKLPDLDSARKRSEQRQRELDEEKRGLAETRKRKDELAPELATARLHADELRRRLQAVERARDSRQDAWYSARRLLDDISRLDELFRTQEDAASKVQELAAAIEKKRERVASFRIAQTLVFQHASKFFDALVSDFVGSQGKGRVTLDGNGLHLTIELDGERSTAAIDLLKVLAFDLSVLCMSIEGSTHVPAFLLHDSPREADLGLCVYHRIFRLARSLEQLGDQPLFQYIVTTTTRPPDELSTKPWVCLKLEGAPAERRLLQKDL